MAQMHQIRFPASVRPCLRWRLTHTQQPCPPITSPLCLAYSVRTQRTMELCIVSHCRREEPISCLLSVPASPTWFTFTCILAIMIMIACEFLALRTSSLICTVWYWAKWCSPSATKASGGDVLCSIGDVIRHQGNRCHGMFRIQNET